MNLGVSIFGASAPRPSPAPTAAAQMANSANMHYDELYVRTRAPAQRRERHSVSTCVGVECRLPRRSCVIFGHCAAVL
eukprot:6206497-Pleurochrysis_carterae.AAC.1